MREIVLQARPLVNRVADACSQTLWDLLPYQGVYRGYGVSQCCRFGGAAISGWLKGIPGCRAQPLGHKNPLSTNTAGLLRGRSETFFHSATSVESIWR